jgi:type II secretory pathway predicted ATPase ExeA
MYETRFGLGRRPFPATPDCACYYPATTHERALALLRRALTDGDGIVVLTGAPGTGKTLLCHCLLERLGPTAVSAFLTNSHLGSRAALLQALLYDLSLPYDGDEQELRLRLTDFLLASYRAGRPVVLIVDEAQHLSPDLLEELRLLGNLEGGGGRAVQVVLVGQAGLLETLRLPGLAALGQRVTARARLEPLGAEEAIDYLRHHLRAAGGLVEEIATEEALALLACRTAGVPRLLNQAAHQALALADAGDSSTVDVEAALEALAALGLEGAEESGPGPEGEPAIVEAGVLQVGEDSGECLLFEAPRRPA